MTNRFMSEVHPLPLSACAFIFDLMVGGTRTLVIDCRPRLARAQLTSATVSLDFNMVRINQFLSRGGGTVA
jgi:hypothetical protein